MSEFLGLEVLPTDGCCFCVPMCCGLRSGVLTIAIIQTLLGLFYLFLAISALVTALTTGSNIESSWQYGLSFVLTVIAGTAWLVVGSMGLAATTNLKAIVELSYDRAVKPAMRYYAANTYGFFIMSAVLFLGAVLYTMGILLDTYANDDGDPLLKETWQVVLSLVTIWLLALLGIGLQFYFLYIVWSYKAKLEAAYYGRPYRGSFVVDGEGPRPSITMRLDTLHGHFDCFATSVSSSHNSPSYAGSGRTDYRWGEFA